MSADAVTEVVISPETIKGSADAFITLSQHGVGTSILIVLVLGFAVAGLIIYLWRIAPLKEKRKMVEFEKGLIKKLTDVSTTTPTLASVLQQEQIKKITAIDAAVKSLQKEVEGVKSACADRLNKINEVKTMVSVLDGRFTDIRQELDRLFKILLSIKS